MTIKDRIVETLIENGVNPITATFAFAQAAHETGNFTSVVFLSNNNCFGMRPPKVYTVAIGERLGYALYKSIEDSAKAMAIYLQAHNLAGGLSTLDQYVTNLHNQNYFEADLQEYLNGVRHFYNLYYGNS